MNTHGPEHKNKRLPNVLALVLFHQTPIEKARLSCRRRANGQRNHPAKALAAKEEVEVIPKRPRGRPSKSFSVRRIGTGKKGFLSVSLLISKSNALCHGEILSNPEPEPVAEAAGKPMRKTHSVGGKEFGENMEVPAEKVSNTVISPYVSYLSSLRKRTIPSVGFEHASQKNVKSAKV